MQLEQLCVQCWRRALPDARLVVWPRTDKQRHRRPTETKEDANASSTTTGLWPLLSPLLCSVQPQLPLCLALPSLSSASDSEHSCCALLTKEYLEAAPLLAVAARTRPRQAGLFLAFPAVPHIYSSIQHRLLYRFIIDSQTSPTCT
jgi:hypothetical protein